MVPRHVSRLQLQPVPIADSLPRPCRGAGAGVKTLEGFDGPGSYTILEIKTCEPAGDTFIAHRHTATSRTSRRRVRLTLYTFTAYPYSPRALWAARRS